MVDQPIATPMTADDLLRLPDDNWRYELVRGKLIRRDYLGTRSGVVSAKIGAKLGRYTEEHHLGICGAAGWGFLLESAPDTVRPVSAGFVRAEQVPTNDISDGYWPGAPDLAIDILSTSDGFTYQMTKAVELLAAGARLVWLIDPDVRKAVNFRPGQMPAVVYADGELRGEDVVPGFVLRLADVWV
jgi:Uma2 family endonuclease